MTQSSALPAGQRARDDMPRFGIPRLLARTPANTKTRALHVTGRVQQELRLSDAFLGLPRVEQYSDFHCVTTWSCRRLHWSGVRFRDLYAQVIAPQARPQPDATLVVLRGQDGARTALPLEDLLADDVLLADALQHAPLDLRHGAPLRLVAPAHYGYKSVKHLHRIEFRVAGTDYPVSAFRFMDHPRARVALEERGRIAPGWLLRWLYRPMIGPTARRAAALPTLTSDSAT